MSYVLTVLQLVCVHVGHARPLRTRYPQRMLVPLRFMHCCTLLAHRPGVTATSTRASMRDWSTGPTTMWQRRARLTSLSARLPVSDVILPLTDTEHARNSRISDFPVVQHRQN